MPELPEIETIKLQLQRYLVGQEITKLEQLHPKSVQGDLKLVEGKKIIGVERKGKMLIINLVGGIDIVVHFKMTGQLILVRRLKLNHKQQRIAGGHPTKDWLTQLPSKHTRAIFYFKSGDIVYFNDQRIFGWIKILANKEVEQLASIQKLGPEPWDITDEQLHNLFAKRNQAIKLVLMDQQLISGIGNIYANDGLWEARIHPQTEAKKLSYKDTKILRKSLIKVLREGIKYGGATASDAKYLDLEGLGGRYQEHFRTYDREGKPCLACKTPIKKIIMGGRGTYFCPKCQVKA